MTDQTEQAVESPRPQRRGRRIAMTAEEVDQFLRSERTCRVATLGPGGAPHVAPLWFVWDGSHVWLTSIVRSQRWADIQRDQRMALVVDVGDDFFELRGVEVTGRAEVVGNVPRTDTADSTLGPIEQLFADKYSDGNVVIDGRHAWLRIRPEKLVSWDHRKIG